jgi:Mg-chelatase subunit ChlD
MPIRQRLVTYGVSTTAAATIVVAALLQPWQGSHPGTLVQPPIVEPTTGTGRAVDVVFAVDTTGSMGGLIEGAKRTVWSIATHIRDTDPNADLRIGLVAYRDVGDEYVTRHFGLTGELDAVFTELSGYRANGGGDMPENVDAALDATLHKMQWRDGAKKLVFLVGDAPPASRGDVPRFDELAREAGDRQIIINTIRCGSNRETERAWQKIASLGNGQYSSIQQDGGVQQIATPYDEKLAELSARIDSTTVIVGDEDARAAHVRNLKATSGAPAPAKADRAGYYAKGGARSSKDLVTGVESGAMSVEAVPATALPEEMREMDKAELKAEIARRVEQRKAAQVELGKLARQRDEYLKAQAPGASAGSSFDGQVKAAIETQLKK